MRNRIDQIRALKDISIRDISEITGLSIAGVHAITKGTCTPSLINAYMISEVLGKKVTFVFPFKRND